MQITCPSHIKCRNATIIRAISLNKREGPTMFVFLFFFFFFPLLLLLLLTRRLSCLRINVRAYQYGQTAGVGRQVKVYR